MKKTMQKKMCVLAMSLLIGSSPLLVSAENAVEDTAVKQVGFECASELAEVIPLLGKGNDFPAFLISDVEKELKKQHKSSEIQRIECTGEPELKAATVSVDGKDALSKLSISFPLSLEVRAQNQTVTINIQQYYLAENLDVPGKQKVTQKFIVN